MEKEISTEHFTPQKTDFYELDINLNRYMFACEFLEGKTVLDLGCGSGFGTYLYSLLAEKVIAVDYDANAIEEAKKWPYPKNNVEFIHGDITDQEFFDTLPSVDVCVALEVLEHIEEPAALLRDLKCNRLVFCLPLHSMEVSEWHKYPIETERDIRALIQPFFQIGRYEEQTRPPAQGVWWRGEATKFESN